jgi:hypothetical protein
MQPASMGPSLRDHVRPSTRDNRPVTRDQVDSSLIIPSRTSSLHSRITQPIPATLNMKPTQRAPKTLTHAYMVCGVGREPSQWVRAPQTAPGKIQHMKGAVGQFWLPEILGSSPRMDQDNEMAKSLHAAMRVCTRLSISLPPFLALSQAAKHGILTSLLGLFPPRRRTRHWSKPTAMPAPLFCPAARFSAHALRYCPPRVVSNRREACRNHSRASTKDGDGLP